MIFKLFVAWAVTSWVTHDNLKLYKSYLTYILKGEYDQKQY